MLLLSTQGLHLTSSAHPLFTWAHINGRDHVERGLNLGHHHRKHSALPLDHSLLDKEALNCYFVSSINVGCEL